MIRRLSKKDDAKCQELLHQRPAENLFIIGDIENFGYEQDFQKLWGEFNASGKLVAILLKYHKNYICYAANDFDAEGFAQIINEDHSSIELSGLQHITEKITPFITHMKEKSRALYYAKCVKMSQQLTPALDTRDVIKASIKDVPFIAELYDQIVEFEVDESREVGIKRSLENGSARIFYKRENDLIVSSASTTAENSQSAMVIGVCTHPDYKQKGYASLCMRKLCEELLSEGKTLCLFYDNPEAGSIYKRLGFEDIGYWTMHLFEPNHPQRGV